MGERGGGTADSPQTVLASSDVVGMGADEGDGDWQGSEEKPWQCETVTSDVSDVR